MNKKKKRGLWTFVLKKYLYVIKNQYVFEEKK